MIPFRAMRWIAWAFVAVLAAGCAEVPEDEATPVAAAIDTSDDVATTPAPAPAPAAQPRQPAIYALTIEPSDARVGEDGHGRRVAATAARALVVRAEAWPGRALDPVLHVGRLRFHHYDHPSKNELRYVVADVALLPDGAEVALQYGEDTRSRIVLDTALEVQR